MAPSTIANIKRKDYGLFFDGFVFGSLNPLNNEWKHKLVRIVFPILVFVVGFFVTFFYDSYENQYNRDIFLGGALAVAVSQLAVYVSHRFIWNDDYVKSEKGFLPMVSWMGFWMFLECAYIFVHPQKDEDLRETEEIRNEAQIIDERSDAVLDNDGRFFLDAVADIGDGFSSTYAVASVLAQRSLVIEEIHGKNSRKTVRLPKASVTFLNGDLAYPFPAESIYEDRFLNPYTWSFPEEAGTGKEKMYIVCGNHEWLNFDCVRTFLLPRTNIGGYLTPQTGIYFAMKLPYGWWLFGIDLGPAPEDLDDFQRDFFLQIAENEVGTDEKIILMYHVPDWIKTGAMFSDDFEKLGEFRAELGDQVRLVLAGDLHYYRRQEVESSNKKRVSKPKRDSADQDPESNCFVAKEQTYITAGFGGAFLHSTSGPIIDRQPNVGQGTNDLITKCCYPTVEEADKIWSDGTYSWIFNTTNGYYMRVLGAVYSLLFLCVVDFTPSLFSLIATGWLLVTHFILVTASHTITNWFKVFAMVIVHSAAHVGLAVLLRLSFDSVYKEMDLVSYSSYFPMAREREALWQAFLLTIYMGICGSLAGTVLSSLYFDICYRFLDHHWNEAIALVQNEDYKGFLRLGFNPDESIDVYCIGIDQVPKKWEFVDDTSKSAKNPSLVAPTDMSLKYRLVEKVTITK